MSEETIGNALKYFSEDHNCAQSVFRSILERYDLYFDQATSVVAGMGGGIGLQGNVCGAVVGAVAALGMLNRQKHSDFKEHKNATYTSAAKLMYKFKKMHETVLCDELTGIMMSDSVARDLAIENGHFKKVCPSFVEDAVRIVLDMESKA